MKKIYSFIIALVLIVSFSCSREQMLRSYSVPANARPLLNESDIYIYKNVYAAIKLKISAENNEIAENLLKYSKYLMTDNRRSDEVLKTLKQAITFCPDDKTYFALGDYLYHKNKMAEAITALRLAGRLPSWNNKYDNTAKSVAKLSGVSPIKPMAYFDLARVYGSQKDTNNAVSNLGYALRNGYEDEHQINKQDEFQFLKQSAGFRALMVEYFQSKKDLSALFASFTAYFSPASLPYTIDNSNAAFKGERIIPYAYKVFIPEMKNSRYSREAVDNYAPVAVLAKNKTYILLMYVADQQFMDTFTRVSLATFDRKGNLLDTIVFASNSTEFTAKGTISTDLKIKVSKYRKFWKYDLDEEGFENNYVIRRDLVETRLYELDKTGFFNRKGIVQGEKNTAVKD